MPLPVPGNQKMNGYLKEIAAMGGIDKILTSHIARHTFVFLKVLNWVQKKTISHVILLSEGSGAKTPLKLKTGE